ncbi:hypothetical protein EV363DRAFT_1215692 [Boletus edulis]|nr:hypothetical protein EV363DRAFT_1215692 [Boletus edulis]
MFTSALSFRYCAPSSRILSVPAPSSELSAHLIHLPGPLPHWFGLRQHACLVCLDSTQSSRRRRVLSVSVRSPDLSARPLHLPGPLPRRVYACA